MRTVPRDYTKPPPSLRELHTGRQACRDTGPDVFYADDAQTTKAAKSVCLGDGDKPPCPVLEPCRHYALHYEKFGVWGGLDERELIETRRRLGITKKVPIPHSYLFRSYTRAAAQKRAERARYRERERERERGRAQAQDREQVHEEELELDLGLG